MIFGTDGRMEDNFEVEEDSTTSDCSHQCFLLLVVGKYWDDIDMGIDIRGDASETDGSDCCSLTAGMLVNVSQVQR